MPILLWQLRLVGIHLANSVANALGQDVLSRGMRRFVLRRLGVRIGPGSVIDGGGYVFGSQLQIGRRCFVNRGCYFDLTGRVQIGDEVEVGHGVTFITAHHEIGRPCHRAGRVRGEAIVVGDGAWIGACATLLPGVHIGRGAVVAAGALVTRDVADNTLVAGVPARPMRNLNEELRSA
jgi:maltose O-acetyltransferase